MAEGGKKDAPYIAQLFNTELKDLASQEVQNVQKAGEILAAIVPDAYCIHGGEHVISLSSLVNWLNFRHEGKK